MTASSILTDAELAARRKQCAVFHEQRRNKTHCIHGHELSGTNLYVTSKGKRQCKICKVDRNWYYRRGLKFE